MNKEQLIELGLTEEQATKVLGMLDDNFIPKTRFDEINNSNKQLKKDILSRDGQLEELKKVDAPGLETTIANLQKDNELAKEQYEKELATLKLHSAIDKELLGAKAKNIKAAKALLDIDKVTIEDDEIKGLTEQLTTLKETDSYLFDVENEPPSPTFKGFSPKDGKDMDKPTGILTYTEMLDKLKK